MKQKRFFLIGLVITTIVFLSILLFNSIVNDKRESVVNQKMSEIVKENEDMQTMMLMSEFYGKDATCVALKQKLIQMNKNIWDLGIKIDQYRQSTEQFLQDPFYIEQKTEFNRKQILYFAMLKKTKEDCKINTTIVAFFYKRKEDCKDCDAQSFVLSDIIRDLEKMEKNSELAIFSFDADMDIPTIKMLIKAYNIEKYPAIVIGNMPYFGLYDKDEIKSILCKQNKLSICN